MQATTGLLDSLTFITSWNTEWAACDTPPALPQASQMSANWVPLSLFFCLFLSQMGANWRPLFVFLLSLCLSDGSPCSFSCSA